MQWTPTGGQCHRTAISCCYTPARAKVGVTLHSFSPPMFVCDQDCTSSQDEACASNLVTALLSMMPCRISGDIRASESNQTHTARPSWCPQTKYQPTTPWHHVSMDTGRVIHGAALQIAPACQGAEYWRLCSGINHERSHEHVCCTCHSSPRSASSSSAKQAVATDGSIISPARMTRLSCGIVRRWICDMHWRGTLFRKKRLCVLNLSCALTATICEIASMRHTVGQRHVAVGAPVGTRQIPTDEQGLIDSNVSGIPQGGEPVGTPGVSLGEYSSTGKAQSASRSSVGSPLRPLPPNSSANLEACPRQQRTSVNSSASRSPRKNSPQGTFAVPVLQHAESACRSCAHLYKFLGFPLSGRRPRARVDAQPRPHLVPAPLGLRHALQQQRHPRLREPAGVRHAR